jgi:hypothetical protein
MRVHSKRCFQTVIGAWYQYLCVFMNPSRLTKSRFLSLNTLSADSISLCSASSDGAQQIALCTGQSET